ncbi:MAG: hypothetical protein LBE92_05560 [Chryseobacterium sp.]|jgi:hypothetical protein|uniref:hypothetical protein n=1 Tax=Chryseobacterium sp. TaxID=1871047 RepID=UPI00283A7CFD|nr:hypothetical protein [Chryseobacterium sp.]MDR2235569.1 hypothetical protein [Chryseobacterium sp.]
MKNILFVLILIFPVIITLFCFSKVLDMSSKLQFISEVPIAKENSRVKLYIDKHASKRRIYFFVKKDSKLIQYKREYRGLITNWRIALKNEAFVSENHLSFYTDSSKLDNDNEKPFFSLNNERKNFDYYSDVFQYVKEKYFFYLLIFCLIYVFGSGWLIDYLGGVTQHKALVILLFLDILYLIILLFW